MKYSIIFLCLILSLLGVIARAQDDEYMDFEDEMDDKIMKRQANSKVVRIGCRNGGFSCRPTGQRAISCSTDYACRNCQIKQSGGGALDLYCNDGSNPNGYARCSTNNWEVSCIA